MGPGVILGVWILWSGLTLVDAAEAIEEKDLALERYFTANGLYNRQLYELAAQEYWDFLSTYPDHEKAAKAQLGLALSTYGMGNYADAEPLLERLSSSVAGHERTQIHLIWGQTLLVLNRASDAASAFESGLSNSESASQESLLAGLVEARYQNQEWAEVVKWSRRLAEVAPNGANTWRASFQGAQALYELRQFDEATVAFQALARGSAGSPLEQQIQFLLAESQRESGKMDEAAQSYARAAALEGAFTADSLFRQGYIRFHQERFEDATDVLRQLLRNHADYPSAAPAAILVGRAYLEQTNYSQAEAVFRQLAKSPAIEVEAKLWHGKVLLRRERFSEAERLLSTVVGRESAFKADLLYDYGSALLGQKEFAQAAASFVALADEFSDNSMTPEALRLAALCLHRSGDYATSLVLCKRFKAVDGEAAADRIAFLVGENYFFMNNAEAAVPAYRSFLSDYPNSEESASARMRLGMVFHGQERWSEAAAEFQQLNAVEGPLFAQAKFLLGDAYFELEQWDSAIQALERFAQEEANEPNADTALFKAAQAHERKQDTAQAIARLNQLLSKYPRSPHEAPALVELGRLQYESEQLSDARQALRRVVRRHADSTVRPQADYYLGWIALTETKSDEAIEHFGRVVAEGSDHPLAADARLQRGLLLVETGKFAAGKNDLDTFGKSFPNEARLDQSRFYGGIASVGEENWEDAVSRFRVVIDQHPDSAFRERAHYESAWAEKNAGENARAMDQYKALLTRYPDTDLARSAAFELAELEFEAEDYASVRKRLTTLLPKLEPGDLRARVQYRLAWAQLSAGEGLTAAQTFEAMLSNSPPDNLVAMASFQAGEARLKLREYAQAETHFGRALEAPSNEKIIERILLRLGEAQGLVGRWAESEQSYTRLVTEFPNSPLLRRAQMGIGWSLENQEKFTDAIRQYRTVVMGGERDETSARSQFQIGECLLAAKQFDEAIKAFIQLEVNYGYPEWGSKALLEIGRALEEKEDRDGALSRYREVLNKYPETAAAEVAKDFADNLSGSEN